ncbi:MAG: UDP-N-acetylmuramate dehydrogenase [Bacteroidaceae bacterium]|nr:UDP-N-acetylmuramate dehydrogenase [Bacteroidaceae bacterium]
MRIENTFGIAAEAREVITYDSEEALLEALIRIHNQYEGLPLLHIGQGSNLLFLSNFEGVVLKSNIKGFTTKEETEDDVLVEVGSGEICDDFIAQAIQNGWYGMENLSLIPGQIGAAAVQNIGAYGVEAQDVIEEVKGISLKDGSTRFWKQKDCQYGYRQSVFKSELWGQYAITRVTFRLKKHFEPKLQYGGLVKAVEEKGLTKDTLTAEQLRQIIIDIRRAKLPDPKEQGNAGSFFKNPVVSREKAEQLLSEYPTMPHYPADEGKVKLAAGWLIEQAGWKGKSLGPAAVHDRQALVLVNKGGASGSDIQRLCEAIQKDINERFGIKLEPEVNFI